MELFFLFFILLIVFVESSSLVCLKKYGKGDKTGYLIAGLVGYIIVALLLMKLSTMDDIGVVNALWSVISILAVVVAGNVFFDEKLDTQDFAAIAVAVIAIIALQSNRKKKTS